MKTTSTFFSLLSFPLPSLVPPPASLSSTYFNSFFCDFDFNFHISFTQIFQHLISSSSPRSLFLLLLVLLFHLLLTLILLLLLLLIPSLSSSYFSFLLTHSILVFLSLKTLLLPNPFLPSPLPPRTSLPPTLFPTHPFPLTLSLNPYP